MQDITPSPSYVPPTAMFIFDESNVTSEGFGKNVIVGGPAVPKLVVVPIEINQRTSAVVGPDFLQYADTAPFPMSAVLSEFDNEEEKLAHELLPVANAVPSRLIWIAVLSPETRIPVEPLIVVDKGFVATGVALKNEYVFLDLL